MINGISNNSKRILITGGAGFIGGTLIRKLLKDSDTVIYNLDKLGYASDLSGIENLKESKNRHIHLHTDLKNIVETNAAIEQSKPQLVIHLAAESHVDRSLENPSSFIQSNIVGTFNLLQCTKNYWEKLTIKDKDDFRFHHISTDEVFGSLGPNGHFNEFTTYSPRSPYSASKASSDHLVNAWHHSFGLPTVITNCSNNYGPFQFPEKLIPLTILKSLNQESIPLYGDGKNIRDWLHVEDHVDAILLAVQNGEVGSSYCIGGNSEKTNKDVIDLICEQMDVLRPMDKPHSSLIKFVKDRPGHDLRYSIDSSKITNQLGWEPKYNFEQGIKSTIEWYLNNMSWCMEVMKKSNFKGDRIGLNNTNTIGN